MSAAVDFLREVGHGKIEMDSIIIDFIEFNG
jgi:hypothetical protein